MHRPKNRGWLSGPAVLFCPANRPDRFQKAIAGADAVVLDLEDAVSATGKLTAREALIENQLDVEKTIVRINAVGTRDFELDLLALSHTKYKHIMLAKAEVIPAELSGHTVIALCESPRGILAALDLAATPNVSALMLGSEDLVAAVGGTSSRGPGGSLRPWLQHARSLILLAAAAHGKQAIDSVYPNIADLESLTAEAEDSAASGFSATACVHPSQVPIIRRAYAPTPQEVEHARRIIIRSGQMQGVFVYEGKMIDEPVLRHARVVLSRAGIDSQEAVGESLRE